MTIITHKQPARHFYTGIHVISAEHIHVLDVKSNNNFPGSTHMLSTALTLC